MGTHGSSSVFEMANSQLLPCLSLADHRHVFMSNVSHSGL